MHKFVLVRPSRTPERSSSVLRLECSAEELLRDFMLGSEWLVYEGESVTVKCVECERVCRLGEMSCTLFKGDERLPMCKECEQWLRPCLFQLD